MNSRDLSAQAYARTPNDTTPLTTRRSRDVLLVLVALVYSGLFLFGVNISLYLLYGFYLVLLVLILADLFSDTQTIERFKPIAPYLYWFILYCSWGTLISPDNRALLSEVIRMIIRNLLIVSAFVVALPDTRRFTTFARWIQIAVILNGLIAVWESIDPTLIIGITSIRNMDTTAFDVLRPAGLWINPDEAAFALLFGLLIAARDHGVLAWLSRIAAVVGIFLSASRTGAYLLVVYGVAFALFKLHHARFNPLRLSGLFVGAALLIALCFGISSVVGTLDIAVADQFQLARILDFSESVAKNGYARADVTSTVVETVLKAPPQGYGIFALQGIGATSTGRSSASLGELGIGAHNIYLAVWGEVGIIGLLGYLLALFAGVTAMLKARLSAGDRLIATLMWVTYLLMGFVWHNQFTDVVGVIYVGLLFCFPRIAALPRPGTTPRGQPHRADEAPWR